MRAVAVALLLEEQRGEILAAWRRDVERELGGDPALAFAVGPLLREMALSLRGDASPLAPARSPEEAGARSAVLVRSGAPPARIAREFKLLHRALWSVLRLAGAVVGADERRAGDEWLDEALAAALDRQDRVRTRADLVEPAAPAGGPPVARRAPPSRGEIEAEPPRAAAPARAKPPPLPLRAPSRPRAARPPVIPARPPPLPVPAAPGARAVRPPPLPLPAAPGARAAVRPPPLPLSAVPGLSGLE